MNEERAPRQRGALPFVVIGFTLAYLALFLLPGWLNLIIFVGVCLLTWKES